MTEPPDTSVANPPTSGPEGGGNDPGTSELGAGGGGPGEGQGNQGTGGPSGESGVPTTPAPVAPIEPEEPSDDEDIEATPIFFLVDDTLAALVVAGFFAVILAAIMAEYGYQWMRDHPDQLPGMVEDRLPGGISAGLDKIRDAINSWFSDNDPGGSGAVSSANEPPPHGITGRTKHGDEQINGRDGGRGVKDEAVNDAVNSPVAPPIREVDAQGRVSWVYEGKDARVVLNPTGKVVTAIPKNSNAVRNPQ
jgi:hypothetical protein